MLQTIGREDLLGLRAAGLALCVLALGLGAPGCSNSSGGNNGAAPEEHAAEKESKAEAIAVRIAPVERSPVSALYSTSGTLRADKQAVVTARAAGVVRRLLVEEGDRVEEGEPLAFLEDDEQQIESARTSASYETALREYQRAERLHSEGLLSDEEYERTRREHAEAKQAAALAELNLSRTVVRAPFRGRILKRYLDVGATVSDGTAVYDLADLDPLYTDVNVPERHVARLDVGQTVRLEVDATGQSVGAEIERIAPGVDPSTGTVKITLAIDGSGGLRPGSFVRVDVVTDTHPDALVVPRSALVAAGRRWHLFRLAPADDSVEQLEVHPGFEEGDKVEILEVVGEAELEPGARVVVVGAAALADGARVLVVEDDREVDVPSESTAAGA